MRRCRSSPPKTIKSLNDLEGKTVSVDLPMRHVRDCTGLFSAARDQGELRLYRAAIANGKIEKGDLDASSGWRKPYVSVTTFNNDGRFHLAAVGLFQAPAERLSAGALTSKDYPNLNSRGETVGNDRSAVGACSVQWHPTRTPSQACSVVDAFFTKFAALQNPPFLPSGRSLPDGTARRVESPTSRTAMADKHAVEPVKRRFEAFRKRTQPPLTSSRSRQESHIRQFRPGRRGTPRHRWARRWLQEGRDHASQSATQAAPPRPPPRRSHPARPAT